VVEVAGAAAYPSSIVDTPGATSWISFPMLRYAVQRGEKLKPLRAIVTERIYDPFGEVKQKLGDEQSEGFKQWFLRLTGRLSEYRKTRKSVLATTAVEIVHHQKHGLELVRSEAMAYGVQLHYLTETADPGLLDHGPVAPLIAFYLHCYTKLTVHHDLLSRLSTAGLRFEHVQCIEVDGVGLTRPLPDGFLPDSRWKKPAARFPRPGTTDPRPREALLEQSSSLPPPSAWDPLLLAPRVALLGPPGSGKTHSVARFWAANGRKLKLTASTHLAADTLARAVGGEACTTQKFIREMEIPHNFPARGYDRVVCDEFTMLGKREAEKLVSKFTIPLLFCGDFEQLGNSEDPIARADLEAWGFVVHELAGCHRSDDRETYAAIRGQPPEEVRRLCCLAGAHRTDEVRFPAAFARSHLLASANRVVDQHNIAYARRLAGPAAPARAWGMIRTKDGKEGEARRLEAPAVEGMLVIGLRKSRGLRNQEIGYLLRDLGGDKALVRNLQGEEVQANFGLLHPGFALTFHRCQGQTFDFPVYVWWQTIFDRVMPYVSATRMRKMGDLYFVTPGGWGPRT
jgi:hypothetical protein